MSEQLPLTSSDGLSLEAELDAPDAPKAAVVLCHPHPKMGGTMNAPLLLALRDAMVERGWAVLRFNFRGIGASEGEASTGIEEVADARAAIEAAKTTFEGLPTAISGWSFGGAVALRAVASDPGLSACAVVAPAIVAKPGITAGAPPAEEFDSEARVLVVCGANDDQVSPAACRGWAEATGARYEEVAGANHFFWAKYEPLAALVGDFLDAAIA